MNDALAVRCLQRFSDLDAELQGLLDGQRAALHPVTQGLAFQVLHHQEVHALLLADVVQRANVRMRQLGDGAGLALEALVQVREVGKPGREDLDGDGAVEACVPGPVDLAHAPRGDSIS